MYIYIYLPLYLPHYISTSLFVSINFFPSLSQKKCKKHGLLTLINSLFLKIIYFLNNIFFRKTSKCHSVTLRSDASKISQLNSILSSFVIFLMHQTKVSRTPSYSKRPDSNFRILSHPIWNISLIYRPINMEYVM